MTLSRWSDSQFAKRLFGSRALPEQPCSEFGQVNTISHHKVAVTKLSGASSSQGATVRTAQRWDNVCAESADRHLATFRQAAARTSRPVRRVREDLSRFAKV
jgi:hypothetical protein